MRRVAEAKSSATPLVNANSKMLFELPGQAAPVGQAVLRLARVEERLRVAVAKNGPGAAAELDADLAAGGRDLARLVLDGAPHDDRVARRDGALDLEGLAVAGALAGHRLARRGAQVVGAGRGQVVDRGRDGHERQEDPAAAGWARVGIGVRVRAAVGVRGDLDDVERVAGRRRRVLEQVALLEGPAAVDAEDDAVAQGQVELGGPAHEAELGLAVAHDALVDDGDAAGDLAAEAQDLVAAGVDHEAVPVGVSHLRPGVLGRELRAGGLGGHGDEAVGRLRAAVRLEQGPADVGADGQVGDRDGGRGGDVDLLVLDAEHAAACGLVGREAEVDGGADGDVGHAGRDGPRRPLGRGGRRVDGRERAALGGRRGPLHQGPVGGEAGLVGLPALELALGPLGGHDARGAVRPVVDDEDARAGERGDGRGAVDDLLGGLVGVVDDAQLRAAHHQHLVLSQVDTDAGGPGELEDPDLGLAQAVLGPELLVARVALRGRAVGGGGRGLTEDARDAHQDGEQQGDDRQGGQAALGHDEPPRYELVHDDCRLAWHSQDFASQLK